MSERRLSAAARMIARRWMEVVRWIAPVVGGVVGGLLANTTVIWGTNFAKVVHGAPIFLAWLSLLSAQGVLAGAGGLAACGVVWTWARRASFEQRVGAVTAALVTVVVLGLQIFLAPRLAPLPVKWPLSPHFERTMWLAIETGTGSAVALTALWLVGLATRPPLVGPRSALATAVRDLADRRDLARRLLWFLGAQVSVLTVATGTLDRAIRMTDRATEAGLPPQLVLAYSAYFAVELACAYFPVHAMLTRTGIELRDELLAGFHDPIEVIERRRKLSELLELDRNFAETFRDLVPIASPLIAGVVSFALPS
jgi:hypothetical protein